MLNLIKLEFKKYKFNGSWLGILIANVAIMGIIALMYFDPASLEDEISLLSYQDAFAIIDTIVRTTFIIYASTLIAKFVIDEYRQKTISLMFTYPVSRKKLMTAKLTIIFVWTVLAIIVSNIVVTSAFVLTNNYFGYIPGALTTDIITDHVLRTLLTAVSAAGLGLIPLLFGMWKKSVPGTIVSSIVIVSIFSSSTNGFSLFEFVAVPIILAVVGIIIAYFSIRNVDKVDLV